MRMITEVNANLYVLSHFASTSLELTVLLGGNEGGMKPSPSLTLDLGVGHPALFCSLLPVDIPKEACYLICNDQRKG